MNNFQIRTLEKVKREEDKLNSWELEFVDSLLSKDEDYELSYRQNAMLNKLWQKE